MSVYLLSLGTLLLYFAGLVIGSAWSISIRGEWAGLGIVLAIGGAVVVAVAS